MFDLDRIEEIWVTIVRNKVRSLLTAFGVFWGIFMLVIMSGAGNGLKRGAYKYIDGFANNSCFIGVSRTSLPYKGLQKGREWNIRNKDLKILKDSVPGIQHLSPILWADVINNNVVNGSKTGSYQVRGVLPNYAEIERQTMPFGRPFNEIDSDNKRKVCIIGTKVYEELFRDDENPLNREIRVNGVYFQVIGVTVGISDVDIGGKLENTILVPLTTLQQITNKGDVIQSLAVTSLPSISINDIEDKIKMELKKINSIHPDDLQAVWSTNLEKEFLLFSNLFDGIAILVWIIGSGTLFAGVIGVSNIMLVTVRERTKEIGIRRALGASPKTIIVQIMMESLSLTALAGIPGLCTGVYVLYLGNIFWFQHLENVYFSNPMISFDTALVSIIILLISGLLAGTIPAMRALSIKAIDAIREE
ncbi:MAG: ABC transporter permease [Dysgonamonadaceae bacterium]|jgi:putative ABC transport system permease protein|nr:ABC transporter permease [Dysgonamonadaceae bacterium]